MKKLTVKLPVYSSEVCIIVADKIHSLIPKFSKEPSWKKLRFNFDPEDRFYGYAISLNNNKNYYIFYEKSLLTVNTVSHEISHIVDFMFNDKSIVDESEARAYLTGYISENIFNFLYSYNFLSVPTPKVSDKEKSKVTAKDSKNTKNTKNTNTKTKNT